MASDKYNYSDQIKGDKNLSDIYSDHTPSGTLYWEQCQDITFHEEQTKLLALEI